MEQTREESGKVYLKGMIVWHSQLGTGKIIRIEKDKNIKINFWFYEPQVIVEQESIILVKVSQLDQDKINELIRHSEVL